MTYRSRTYSYILPAVVLDNTISIGYISTTNDTSKAHTIIHIDKLWIIKEKKTADYMFTEAHNTPGKNVYTNLVLYKQHYFICSYYTE